MRENVVFVDTETTGLDPDKHEIWEVALISGGKEHQWFLDVDLGRADPYALKVGGFHDRHPHGFNTRTIVNGVQKVSVSDKSFVAAAIAEITRGKHLCGNVISFDEERLRKFLRANGACPEWHYHLIDIEPMVVGYLAAKGQSVSLPWDSDELSRAIGIEPDTSRHEALYDAQWARQLFSTVVGAESPEGNQ